MASIKTVCRTVYRDIIGRFRKAPKKRTRRKR